MNYLELSVKELIDLSKTDDSLKLFYELAKRYSQPRNSEYFDTKKAYDLMKKHNLFHLAETGTTYMDDIMLILYGENVSLETVANNLNAESCRNLADFFYFGTVCPKNYTTAIFFYDKAIEQDKDFYIAAYRLYQIYKDSKSNFYNKEKAKHYFTLMTKSKRLDGFGYEEICIAYHNGDSVIKCNKKEEFKYAKECFDKGLDSNLCAAVLGDIYINYPEVVESDFDLGLEYLEKAAKANEMNALNLLGNLYNDGKKVPKDEQKAFNYYKKAHELMPTFDTALTNLCNIYYKAAKGKITLNVSGDIEKEALELHKKAINLLYDKELSNFEYYQSIAKLSQDFPSISKLTELEKYNCRLSFAQLVSCYIKGSSVDPVDAKCDKMMNREYANGYLLLGMMNNEGVLLEQNIAKAKELFLKAEEALLTPASYELAFIYYNEGNKDLAFKKLLNSATNYKAIQYKFMVTKELLSELDKEVVGCYQAQILLAKHFEFKDGDNIFVSQKQDLKLAKYFYQYAVKSQQSWAEIELVKFGLRHPKEVSDSSMKRYISRNYNDLVFAAAYEKAMELGMSFEANNIYNLILNSGDYSLLSELKTIAKEDVEKIDAVLKTIKKPKKIVVDETIPHTKAYLEEQKRLEEELKEKEKIALEKKKEEERIEKEKKEAEKAAKKALDEAKKAAREKEDQENLDAAIKHIKLGQFPSAMTLFKKNSGRLGNKYPQVLFLIRCALNEKVLHFPDHYSVTLDVKKYINSIYHVSKGYYNYITDPSMIKLYSELQRDYYSIGSYNLKNSPVCSELFRHVGNLISVTRAYINKKADYPEKKFVLLLLYVFESIRGYSGVQFTKYSLLCKTDVQKIKCYHVGSIIGDKGSSYNLLVLEYQKLGLFKKKEKQEITDKMLKMADSLLSYYPAFKWLEKHKVKHNLKKYFSDKDKEQYKNIGLIDFE